jgi:hypothetical protein
MLAAADTCWLSLEDVNIPVADSGWRFSRRHRAILWVRYDAAELAPARVTAEWCKDHRLAARYGALGGFALHCGALRSISATSALVLHHP